MNYIMQAREAVETYDIFGGIPLIDLQNVLAVLIGPKATPQITGKLASIGIRDIVDLSIVELQHFGLSKLEAERVQAGCLLAKSLVQAKPRETTPQLNSPDKAAAYVMDEMRLLKEEHFVAVYLDVKLRVIHKQTVFVGTANGCIAHQREVFREAVKRSAVSIMIFHNHPAGESCPPSEQDLDLTANFIAAGEVLNIPVEDHIIIGDGNFLSLKHHPYSYTGRKPFSSNRYAREHGEF